MSRYVSFEEPRPHRFPEEDEPPTRWEPHPGMEAGRSSHAEPTRPVGSDRGAATVHLSPRAASPGREHGPKHGPRRSVSTGRAELLPSVPPVSAFRPPKTPTPAERRGRREGGGTTMIVASVVAGGAVAAVLGSSLLVGVTILAALTWTPSSSTQLAGGVVPQTSGASVPGTPGAQDLGALAAAPAAAPGRRGASPGSQGWIDAAVARVSSVASQVSPEGVPSTSPLPPSAEGAVASTIVPAVPAAPGTVSATAAAPPGAQVVAASRIPGAPPGAAPGAPISGVDALIAELQAERRRGRPAPATPVDLLAGSDGLELGPGSPGAGDGRGRPVAADDPARALVAGLDAPAAAPSGASSEIDALIAELSATSRPAAAAPRRSSPSPVAPAAPAGDWFGVAAAAVQQVAVAVGVAPPEASPVAARLSPRASATPGGSVDLLAGDDGLDLNLSGSSSGSAWARAGGVPPTAGPTAEGSAELDALVAGLISDGPGPTAAEISAREDSWLSTATSAVSAVSEGVRSIVMGGDAPLVAATPSVAGAATVAATPSVAGAATVAATPAPSDRILADDGLSELVDDLAAERRRSGWAAPARADDPARAILADLDAPSPAGRAAPEPQDDRAWTNTASDWVSKGASIVTGNAAPVPERPTAARPTATVIAAAAAAAARPTSAAAAIAAATASGTGVGDLGGAPTAARSVTPPAAPAAPRCAPGELCSDRRARGWRDQGQSVDLLAEEDVALELGSDEITESELFNVPTVDDDGADTVEMDSLETLLVQISLDGSGIPIEIDGEEAGSVPGALQLTPGVHTVTLYNRGVTSTFRLEAVTDPDEWCFESKGRNFRPVRCR
ncbi:MAG TPA: hypothetical protein ENK18_01485 [Deltaproteobacteria bacterium]|nr:hypothetical protein [Deltaproteobacteria bacterium]